MFFKLHKKKGEWVFLGQGPRNTHLPFIFREKTKCIKKRKLVDNICVCLSGNILDIKSKKKQ